MNKEAKLFINNKWTHFVEKSGTYDNILAYLDNNNISFVKSNYIDFNTIPKQYHGVGFSRNLLDYISNNSNNNNLIFSFINYYFNKLQIKYTDGTIFKLNVDMTDNWKTSKIRVFYNQRPIITISSDQTIYTVDNYNVKTDMNSTYI